MSLNELTHSYTRIANHLCMCELPHVIVWIQREPQEVNIITVIIIIDYYNTKQLPLTQMLPAISAMENCFIYNFLRVNEI
jgi:hypothetical protein